MPLLPIGLWSPAPASGKSTVAQLILELQPHRRLLPFADPLRAMLRPLLLSAGYSHEQATAVLNTPQGKASPLTLIPGAPTPRRLLQTIGTDWGRDLIHPDLWIHIWLFRARCSAGVIADDVRFNSEANAIRQLGGSIWAVTRPGATDASGHPSEAGIDPQLINHHIINNSTIDNLRSQIQHLLHP
jgi:hypothetical protein